MTANKCIAASATVLVLSGCGDVAPAGALAGVPGAGKQAITQYACHTCHTIPGVTGANRMVGPPLGGVAKRTYIAGVLPNTPENMLRWIRTPLAVDPLTAMPDMGVTEAHGRDIVAYLYTLE